MPDLTRDPRVTPTDDGYIVNVDGVPYTIVDHPVAGWIVTAPSKRRSEPRIVRSNCGTANQALAVVLTPQRR